MGVLEAGRSMMTSETPILLIEIHVVVCIDLD